MRRSGVIIAMSSGLVASMALPASATTASALGAGGPQTASIPAVPAGDGSAFYAAPEGGLLALPTDLVSEDAPVTADPGATITFDRTPFTALTTRQGTEAPQTRREAKQATSRSKTTTGQTSTSTKPSTKKSTEKSTSSSGTGSTAAPMSVSGSSVVSIASRYFGVPYRYGGTTPRGFDCSGFVQYVYAQNGKSLPRTVAQQRSAVQIIPRSQAKPGDLVIFGTSHIAIYAGGNMMIDAPRTGKTISKRAIYTSNVSFGRV